MDRVFKSKVGWWYHLILLVMAASTVAAFVGGKSPVTMIVLLLFTLECIHMLLSTWYKITADGYQGLGADMEMAKNLQMGVLLDIYGALLTERQREMMDLYYNDDLSLSEIAEQYEISRQGVHDALKRSEETLRHYDNALGLAAAQQQQKDQLLEFKSQALEALDECRKVTFGKNIAEKVIALLENLDSKLEEYENSDYNE